MLLLMTLRKDIFDNAFALNNKLEDDTFCISVFVSSNVHPENGVDTIMTEMYNINRIPECVKMTNGTVKVLLHKDIQSINTLGNLPIEIPARKLFLTKMTELERAEDFPYKGRRYKGEGSVKQVSKFFPGDAAWLQNPIIIDRDIILNYAAKVFTPSFGPGFLLQIEDSLISKNSKIHSGLLGIDGMGYLYLPTVMRNWVKKYTKPIEIGNFFTQSPKPRNEGF